ncbi:hypothetical protein K440DRAFT_664094 [Wilcoxina mikolae CBS 423.85]|nr:hypothetical protein K440DRAFT_664094 [Wilcoxina mikolae CBS 423.85]
MSVDPQPPPQKRQKLPPPEHVTIRDHDWAYAALQMIFEPPYNAAATDVSWPPDILTWRTTLTSVLTQFLGITGSAIQIDILHQDGDEAWMRLPRTEMIRFQAAVSGYVGASDGRSVGFKTVGVSEFLMGLVSRKAEAGIWAE